MGVFTAKLILWNPAEPARAAELELWVDTGAAYGWVPRTRLEPLGIRPTHRMQFRTIEGRRIERDIAPVFMKADGRTAGDNVVVGEAGDMEVVGAHTLEALGVVADPVQKRLVPTIALALTTHAERVR